MNTKLFNEKSIKIPNPWRDHVDSWLEGTDKYVCDSDKLNDDVIKKYGLQVNIPPQPYQGTPNAKIWVLLANPGYKDDDPKGVFGDKTFYNNKDNRITCLNQLTFNEPDLEKYSNYILNNEFKSYYGRKWFLDRFVGKDCLLSDEAEKAACEKNDSGTLKDIDNRFFLLQIFGYASENCDAIPDFPHMAYNKALLQWGLMHGKTIIIARKLQYWQNIIESMEHDDTKIFVMLNKRNTSFTPKNLVRYAEWKQSQLILNIGRADVKRHLQQSLAEAENSNFSI